MYQKGDIFEFWAREVQKSYKKITDGLITLSPWEHLPHFILHKIVLRTEQKFVAEWHREWAPSKLNTNENG